MAEERLIAEKVIALISDMTGVDRRTVRMEESLDHLHVDDLGLVGIMMDLEDAFDVVVDDSVNVRTVNDIVQCFCVARAHERTSSLQRRAHTA